MVSPAAYSSDFKLQFALIFLRGRPLADVFNVRKRSAESAENRTTNRTRFMTQKILLLCALTVAATIANRVQAADALQSPRAALLQYELRKAPGTKSNLVAVSVKIGSPKSSAFQDSLRTVPGTSSDMIARGVLPASPRVLANEPWRLQEVQVAPLH